MGGVTSPPGWGCRTRGDSRRSTSSSMSTGRRPPFIPVAKVEGQRWDKRGPRGGKGQGPAASAEIGVVSLPRPIVHAREAMRTSICPSNIGPLCPSGQHEQQWPRDKLTVGPRHGAKACKSTEPLRCKGANKSQEDATHRPNSAGRHAPQHSGRRTAARSNRSISLHRLQPDLRRERLQRRRHARAAAEGGVQGAAADDRPGREAGRVDRGRGGGGDAGLGDREGRDALHALVPAADGARRRRSTTPSSSRTARAARWPSSRGKQLIKGEPDASSFPSGGIRATFEARGYTAWDADEPGVHPGEPERHDAVHSDGVLLVDGRGAGQEDAAAALDAGAEHAGAARAAALRRRRTASRCSRRSGREQEYFLIDRNFFFARPDLIRRGPHAVRRASRPRARRWKTTTSARSPSGCWRSCWRWSGSCTSWACR